MFLEKYKSIIKASLILFLIIYCISCMPYLTQDRKEVLLEGVNIDQSLEVAEMYLNDKKGELGASLSIWVIRDQYFTSKQAQMVSYLYFQHIDSLKKKFDIWHLTWAISNIYRHGDVEVQKVLQKAYDDAIKRAKEAGKLADKMANNEKMYLGDAHGGGRSFAKKHVVVPGNKEYLQSFDEYQKKESEKKSKKKTKRKEKQ